MTQISETVPTAPRRRILVSLWALGALLRLLFVGLEPETSPVADETMWLMALSRIPAAHFSPFSNYPIFHPPLYPYFLATLQALGAGLLATKLVQALIGSLLVPAIFRIALRVFGPRAAVVAGLIVAGYPDLIWYSAHFWCETLFLSLFWWAIERVMAAEETSSRRAAVMAGLLFGLAVLTRETLLYVIPFPVLWLAVSKSRSCGALAALTLTVALLVIAPWTLRNWIQFHAFIPVSTGGGLNLYQGNAEIPRGEVYNEYYANEGKVDQFRWARAEGIKAILRRQPGWLFEKIRDEAPRLAELDSLALIHLRRGAYQNPTCGGYRAVAGVVLVPWILVALGSVLALSRAPATRPVALLIAILVVYLLLHIATHGFSRYRLPVVPVLIVFAASLVSVGRARAGRRARPAILVAMAFALGLLWMPSFRDQLGHLGFAPPPTYEGFARVCP
ncbi:MAG: glycosyltransferase family 39 protein [Vicinamibacteria bacterium]|nr:glycosyltransferase family 39 protein [Vicinamibacteria bacterium]